MARSFGSSVRRIDPFFNGQPPGLILPQASDDNEEINVQGEVTLFEANIER